MTIDPLFRDTDCLAPEDQYAIDLARDLFVQRASRQGRGLPWEEADMALRAAKDFVIQLKCHYSKYVADK